MDKALHTKATVLAKTDPHKLEMPWRCNKNKVDCGTFIMCHMETYVGSSMKGWSCGLQKHKKYQLKRLRTKYIASILVAPCNDLRDNSLERAKEFDAWKKAQAGAGKKKNSTIQN